MKKYTKIIVRRRGDYLPIDSKDKIQIKKDKAWYRH